MCDFGIARKDPTVILAVITLIYCWNYEKQCAQMYISFALWSEIGYFFLDLRLTVMNNYVM